MKTYNSIPHYHDKFLGQSVIAFDKLDGSNMRFEYSPKRGFYKFGTRRDMIDRNSRSLYSDGIDIFIDKYTDVLSPIKNLNYTCFAEFFGDNSIAGQHVETEPKDVVLFDIVIYNKGFMSPSDFISLLPETHRPKIIFDGVLDIDLVNGVRNNKFGLKEGVVCKYMDKKIVRMFKIKTNEWVSFVQTKYGQEYV